MGASTSKAARTAGSAARKYPTHRTPTSTSTKANAPSHPTPAAGPIVHPQTQASSSRDNSINRDSNDPDLALNARLTTLGPVQPNPTYSNSSTFHRTHSQNLPKSQNPNSYSPHSQSQFQPSASSPTQSIFPSAASNPAITLLEARTRLAEEADSEFERIGRRGAKERTFLDVTTIRQILILRDRRGMRGEDIERQLGLGSGVVSRLGKGGIVSIAEY